MRNHSPTISIITPSFNQGQYLEEMILSVISQKYSNYELLIIDAGSTDNTLEVIHKYEQYITYWVSEPDRGQSHAIQKGLNKATGDIINWINSDDLLAPGAFCHIAAEFDLDKYDVLCGYCHYFVNNLAHLDKRNERMGVSTTLSETLIPCLINQPSTFFKGSIIKRLGIDEQYRYTMDVDLWYRYLLGTGISRIKLSDCLLTYFRLHESSKTVSEGTSFIGDNFKVFYNVLFTLNQPEVLLRFMATKIPSFSNFEPVKYQVGVPDSELHEFIRYYAWQALIYYNGISDYLAARACLIIAFRHGQALNLTTIKQLFKQYLVPNALLK